MECKREISIRNIEPDDSICLSLKLCTKLQIINIEHCRFKDDIFESFISCISSCPTLGWIFLKHNNLKDIHSKYIIDKFDVFRSLNCLNLTNNLISKVGAKNLSDNIFRCPTLTMLIINDTYKDIKEEININLQNNINLISNFHSIVLSHNEYTVKLSLFPTLINSFNNGRTLLHHLVIDEKHTELLVDILKHNPTPYLTDIIYDKIPLQMCNNKNKDILEEYMNNY